MQYTDASHSAAARDCRSIELLSPARNLQCGIEALRHGADAVYIGGPGFGARVAAGNSVDDIRQLCLFAHQFNARVYVTMNTILYDVELDDAVRQAWSLYEAGADALIVQDVALLALSAMPPIAMHSSTQMDNRTPQQVQALLDAGFTQTVLARELTLQQINDIHTAVPQMPLEVFVHGAVCVSFSGRCYASQHLFGRSANRGECAQVCRLPFDLVDGDGNTLARQKHLLSLCDMNRSAHLEALMDAGVSSFKIEGRLKDVDYVKNITAYYRLQIDAVLARRSADYRRASHGVSTYTFTPAPERSFNRGFTDYFLTGRPAKGNPHTPKAMGPVVATVTAVRRDHIVVALTDRHTKIAAGDGLCYINQQEQLEGFRVNRVEGEVRLFLRPMPQTIKVGTILHRNHDQVFEAALLAPTADRRVPLAITFARDDDGFTLTATPDGGETVSLHFDHPHEPARAPQNDNIVRQLSRLGDTIYRADVSILSGGDCFIPSSVLAAWRRSLLSAVVQPAASDVCQRQVLQPLPSLPPLNVANRVAAQALQAPLNAFELHPDPSTPLMTCRHCVRRAMGLCGRSIKEPWHLVLADGRSLRLVFDCPNCQMFVYAHP